MYSIPPPLLVLVPRRASCEDKIVACSSSSTIPLCQGSALVVQPIARAVPSLVLLFVVLPVVLFYFVLLPVCLALPVLFQDASSLSSSRSNYKFEIRR